MLQCSLFCWNGQLSLMLSDILVWFYIYYDFAFNGGQTRTRGNAYTDSDNSGLSGENSKNSGVD